MSGRNNKGINNPFYGHRHTRSARKANSLAQKRLAKLKTGAYSPEVCKRRSKAYRRWLETREGRCFRKRSSERLAERNKSNLRLGPDHWNWQGGKSLKSGVYGKDWKYARRECLKRDNFRCRVRRCKNGKVEVHHIVPRSLGGQNVLTNLVTLCTLHNPRGQDGIVNHDQFLALLSKLRLVKGIKLKVPVDLERYE